MGKLLVTLLLLATCAPVPAQAQDAGTAAVAGHNAESGLPPQLEVVRKYATSVFSDPMLTYANAAFTQAGVNPVPALTLQLRSFNTSISVSPRVTAVTDRRRGLNAVGVGGQVRIERPIGPFVSVTGLVQGATVVSNDDAYMHLPDGIFVLARVGVRFRLGQNVTLDGSAEVTDLATSKSVDTAPAASGPMVGLRTNLNVAF